MPMRNHEASLATLLVANGPRPMQGAPGTDLQQYGVNHVSANGRLDARCGAWTRDSDGTALTMRFESTRSRSGGASRDAFAEATLERARQSAPALTQGCHTA